MSGSNGVTAVNDTALAARLVYTEATHIDAQAWDEWLAMYLPDSEFWVPAWKAEHQVTTNPKRELSLIYYASRAGLEDRVWRVRSGKSVASRPMPRTHHAVTNVLLESGGEAAGRLRVLSNWTVHQFLTKSRSTEVLYGRYEHDFVLRDGAWLIERKKIIVLNDALPGALDFYSL
jgi:3-phenylpropionate/cinnamic acid dioxygenase small subunit